MDNHQSNNFSTSASISGNQVGTDTIDNSNHDPEKVVEISPNARYAKLNTMLGKGAYKVVYKAIDREEGIEVAWNCFQTTKQEFNELSHEIEILKRVRHPNIINFHDCWYHNTEFVFITELMTSGTLREYIRKLELPNMKIIQRWSRQILKGLTYLHSHNPPIIHRDIKCDNIFINGAHGEVKIGDMGTAKMKLGKKYTVIGTPEFMAPEMYEEKGYNEKVDVYAFGMCLLEMVTGEYPYSECKNAAQIYKKVTQGIKPECLNKVQDPEVFNLISRCIIAENDRLTAQQIVEHPFLAVEPEVVLQTVSDNKNHLSLQVVFKGMDKMSVKFEFNVDSDTAEEVVGEMIEEDVLPHQFRQLITHEINRILRELAKSEEDDPMKEEAQQNAKQLSWPAQTNIRSELDRAKFELAAAQERALEAEKKAEGAEYRARQAEERERVARHESGAEPRNTSSAPPHRINTTTATSPPSSQPLLQRTQSSSPKRYVAPASPLTRKNDPAMVPLIQTNSISRNDDPRLSRSPTETEKPENAVLSRQFGSSTSLTRKDSQAEWTQDMEIALPCKEYDDERPIEELVKDTALATNRGLEKATEWLNRLNDQDIMTVGDLRDLHDEDWASIGLTVFASRALRNALNGRAAGSARATNSPRIPSRTSSSATATTMTPTATVAPPLEDGHATVRSSERQ